MIRSFRSRLCAPLALAASLIGPLAPAAVACSFHGFFPEPTLVDRLLMSEDILLASTGPDGAPALRRLRGQGAVEDLPLRDSPALIAALAEDHDATLVVVRDDSYGPWISAGQIGDGFGPVLDTIIARLPAWEYDDGTERARYFAGLLDHPAPQVSELALDELDIVTYDRLQQAVAQTPPALLAKAAEGGAHPVSRPVMQAAARDLLPSDDLTSDDDDGPLVLSSSYGGMTEQSLSDMDWTDFAQDTPTALVTGPEPIRILLAGLSGDGVFSAALRNGVAATVGQQTPLLGAYATAWMELDGAAAATALADTYLSDPALDLYSLDMLVQAMSLHSTSGREATQTALRDGLGRAMLVNPAVAESAARQFGLRWDWSLQEQLGAAMRGGGLSNISDLLMVAQYINLARQDGADPATYDVIDTTPLENLRPQEGDDGF